MGILDWGSAGEGLALLDGLQVDNDGTGIAGVKLEIRHVRGTGALSRGGAQIVFVDRRGRRRLRSQFFPKPYGADHGTHAHRKTLLGVIMLPAAALIKLDIVTQPALGEIEPLARYRIETSCA
jgi:hypothetical protein